MRLILLAIFVASVTNAQLPPESYAFGAGGTGECLQGDFILDRSACIDACTALNIPQSNNIAGDNKCYMDSQRQCSQDGMHGMSYSYYDSTKAMMICKVNENTSFNQSKPIDVTISKAGVNVCLGNPADFCESTWLSYPNLNAALFGIDKPSLNPVSNDFISEPGVMAQIFQATYRDETGSMAQYDFLQTIDDLRCAGKFEEYLFTSFEETIESWNSFEQTGMNLQIGTDIEVSAEYKGLKASTTIPPMFTRSWSKSNEAAGMEKHFNVEHGSVAHSRAECSIYRATINIDSPSLKFYSDFESALLHIDAVMRNETTDNEKKEIGIWFVEKYGTHFSQSSRMGSSIAFETRYNQSETMDHDHSTLKECSTRSGAKVFGIQVENDETACEGSLNDTTKGESTYVKRTTHTTIGSFPAESGSLSSWSEQLQHMAREGTLNPSPIRRDLVPILKLLETKAMMNIAHSSGPYKDQKINLTNIEEVLVPAYNDYCANMPGANCHLGCDQYVYLRLPTSNNSWFLTLQHFPFNGRAVYCGENYTCLYFAQGRWNFGYYIGKPEHSHIQTVDCPQVGAEMVNMVQTTISPMYGITDWVDCADICQNNFDCRYWQWNEVTAACYSVANFTGFTARVGFVTGARNCPLSTDSLVTLCPSKGSNALMWRYTTEENAEFFIPGSNLISVECVVDVDCPIGKYCNDDNLCAEPSYDCQSGVGLAGKSIKTIRKCSLVECEQECEANARCKSYDFTRSCKSDSCRLYDSKIQRSPDPGGHSRQFCIKDEDEYYVDDGCHAFSELKESELEWAVFNYILKGRNPESYYQSVIDDIEGFYQSKNSKSYIRCCSSDASVCSTFSNCEKPSDLVTYANAEAECVYNGMRLCTKDELLSDRCCGSGGLCDNYAVWTSTKWTQPQ